MAHDRGFDLHQLVDLARERNTWNRERLLENISDVFLSDAGRLSDRERALIGDILKKLLTDMEMAVRQRLAERFAATDTAPPQVVEQLANDSIEVARPILQRSRVLSDPELIEIIKWRGQEHQVAIAMRQGLSEAVSQNLIDHGTDDVIKALIENHDTQLSQTAINYLVEESRRVDQFQEPLLRRPDLPARLAHRMFWWVSAALRKHILNESTVPVDVLDAHLEEATRSVIAEQATQTRTEAEQLAARLQAQGNLTERFLVQTLRQGRVALFIACFARMIGMDLRTARYLVFEANGDGLAVACKAMQLDRTTFATLFMLTRTPDNGADARGYLRPGAIEKMLQFFDSVSIENAQRALGYWRQDSNYIAAIDEVG